MSIAADAARAINADLALEADALAVAVAAEEASLADLARVHARYR